MYLHGSNFKLHLYSIIAFFFNVIFKQDKYIFIIKLCVYVPVCLCL